MKAVLKIQFLRIREMWPILLCALFMWLLGRYHAFDSAPLFAMLMGLACRGILLSDYQKHIEKQFYIMPLSRKQMVAMNYIQWCLIILLLYGAYLVGMYFNYWHSELEKYWYINSLLIPAAGFTGVSAGMAMYYWAGSDIPRDGFWVIAFCYAVLLVLSWQLPYGGLWEESGNETPWLASFSLVLLGWTFIASIKAVENREI